MSKLPKSRIPPKSKSAPPEAPVETAFVVRPCFQQDLQWVQLIYAHHVMTGTGTFEIEPPSLEEMTSRWTRVVTNGWPYLVASHAKDPTRILGYAYAQPFRDRAAYARTFEDSVYVAPGQEGRGIGKVLLAGLLGELSDLGAREVIAVIGDSRNIASIRLHHALGFENVGIMRSVGYKFATWLDVVLLQCRLSAD